MSEERILKVAQRIFAQKGYKSTTTQEIADKAKVNKAMIYYYFKNKEDLYIEVLKNFFKKISSSFSDVSSMDLSPFEKFKAFLSEYIDIISTNKEMPAFILQCFISRNKKVLYTLKELILPTYRNALVIFEEGRTKGYFRDLDFKNLSMTAVGSVVFYFIASPLFSVLWNEDPLSAKNIEKKKEGLIKLLQNGLVITDRAYAAQEVGK